MRCALFICGVTFLYFQICHSANIVAFMPLPFHSHLIAFKPLWLKLAKLGHKITLIQSDVVIENNENITHIVLSGVHDIIAKHKPLDKLREGQSIVMVMISILEVMYKGMEYELMHPGVQELLKKDKKVDLFFTEFLSTVGFPLGHTLNAPMIGLVSMDTSIEGHMAVGNPTHPVMYPDKDMPFSQPQTFIERLSNTFSWITVTTLSNVLFNPLQEKVVKKCIGQETPATEIIKNISLLFINANPLFNRIRPLGPKTINIGGGIHLLEPQVLPRELQDYLDDAKNGVIYLSFGSVITSKHLLNTTTEVILSTFSQLPYDILWKFDVEVEKKPDNLKVMKWVPQQDVLRHKNVKLFITHGGLQSMEEAIFSYVPMIVVPFFGDQHHNADKMVARGFGLKLDHAKLDVRIFKGAILEILNNSKYREKTKELADLVMDQPMTGLEKAIWWTEYVLRHGHTNHFRNPSNDIPWYQFLLLDVIFFFLLTTVIVIYALVKMLQLAKRLIYKVYNKLAKKMKRKTN